MAPSGPGTPGFGSVAAGTTVYKYPLKMAPGQRYIVDQNGAPFLLKGDSPWALITTLTTEEVDTYLADREAKGFNALLVELIDHKFTPSPPKNVYGVAPFTTPGDFTTPNEAYFAHADDVLRRAAAHGFLVLLTPAWLGAAGGDEGWYNDMKAMGADKLLAYGQFLGKRYATFPNIIWLHGGDFNPPDKTVVQSIVSGVTQFDKVHLNTVDTAGGTSPMDYWGSESWLDLNSVYNNTLLGRPPVYQKSFNEYQLTNWKPFFLKESCYENEHDAPSALIRQQAYEGILSGGFGEFFGNLPIWNFTAGWQSALNARGSLDMTELHTLFSSRHWEKLVPDIGNTFVTNGASYAGAQHLAAARASDGSWAMVYVPTGNQSQLIVDLSGFSGPVSLRWVDPTNGRRKAEQGSPFEAKGTTTVSPPGANAASDHDWVLLVERS